MRSCKQNLPPLFWFWNLLKNIQNAVKYTKKYTNSLFVNFVIFVNLQKNLAKCVKIYKNHRIFYKYISKFTKITQFFRKFTKSSL